MAEAEAEAELPTLRTLKKEDKKEEAVDVDGGVMVGTDGDHWPALHHRCCLRRG